MMDAPMKTCEVCGRAFARNRKFGRAQWAAARFCSRACVGQHHRRAMSEQREPLSEKFRARFDCSGEGCWEWAGTIGGYGYGVMSYAGRIHRAHVLALELDGRPVPKGAVACHHCDNPRCVRPSHLYVGTPQQNADDAKNRGLLAIGSAHPHAKLTESDVAEIRRLRMPFARIAKIYGVSRPTVTRAIKGTTWRHV